MLLASVPFGTRPYCRQSLRTDIVIRENRDAVEAVHHKRTPFGGNRIKEPELAALYLSGGSLHQSGPV